MKKLTLGVLSLFVSVCFFASASAQDSTMKPQLFYLHEEVVPVYMADQYEKTSREFVQVFKDTKLSIPFYASQRDDYHYYYLAPLTNYASIDTLVAAFDKFTKAIADNAADQKLMEDNNDAIEYSQDLVLSRSANLSYHPEGSNMNDTTMKFIHWDFYTIKSGDMDKIIALGKKYKDLCMQKGIKTPYSIWFVAVGPNNNLIIQTRVAKSAEDFYETAKQDDAALGEEGNNIYNQMVPYIVKFTHLNGTIRPDLSYIPD
jgi:hypothetical protein